MRLPQKGVSAAYLISRREERLTRCWRCARRSYFQRPSIFSNLHKQADWGSENAGTSWRRVRY